MKIDKLVFTLLLGCILFACGQKETKERMRTYGDAEKEFVGTLTKEDSITVLGQARICMDSLKAGNIESALNMLYVIRSNQVIPLEGQYREELKTHFRHFPVMAYRLEYLGFSTQGCNDLKYKIEFAEKDENGRVPTMAFTFNPVKVDGKWYLCIKGKEQSGKKLLHPREMNSPAPGEVELFELLSR